MACAETSCAHDGQKVQQFWKFSQLMGPLIGQSFQHLSGLTQVSRKGFKGITVCDLSHTVSDNYLPLAKVFGIITAGQMAC
jgi:hypothetical protein